MRLWRLVLVAFVSLAVLVQGVVPASAAETSAAPYVASDFLSGLTQAKLRNHRVLVTSLLSEESTTWVNPDGTLTTDSFGSPVRVRDVGGLYGWRDLDFNLIFATDGSVVPLSGFMPLKISGGGDGNIVSATNAKGQVFGFGWAEAVSGVIGFGGGAALAKIAIKHTILKAAEKGTMGALRNELALAWPSQIIGEYGLAVTKRVQKLVTKWRW